MVPPSKAQEHGGRGAEGMEVLEETGDDSGMPSSGHDAAIATMITTAVAAYTGPVSCPSQAGESSLGPASPC